MRLKRVALCALAGLLAGCNVVVPPPKIEDRRSASVPANPAPAPASIPAETTKQAPPQALSQSPRIYALSSLRKTTISLGGHPASVWIADDTGKQQEGMMWLKDQDVKADEGFLFVFAKVESGPFWMENTLIPLDIMYFSPSRRLLNVAHGKPLDETNLPSAGPYQYVVEMKGGSAKRLGLAKGAILTVPRDVKGVPDN